ncbi:unnamed protein product [Taenia asiatica]|uniref:Dynactin subunit 2 n=1 Tax=Taenia asiatica TaxID=60517 RepID=A0A0R3VXM3_TAEAS|nr:unnamed protein product [Taenia asiatica]
MDSCLRRLRYDLPAEFLEKDGGSTEEKDALNAYVERLKVSNSPDLDGEKNSKDGIIDALENYLAEQRNAKSKALDADKAKQQMDALIQSIANISIKVAMLEDTHCSLDRTAALRGAMAKQMPVENILREVTSLIKEEKHPQTQLEMPTESSDQLNKIIRCQASKIVSLNKTTNNLRTVRTALQNRHVDISSAFSSLRQDVATAAAEIKASLSRTFNKALTKVEASEQILQNKLEDLNLDMERLKDFLPSVNKVLLALDDKETYFESIVGFWRAVSDGTEMAHATEEAFLHLKMKKYVVSKEEVAQLSDTLNNFDLVLPEEKADRGG